MDRRKGGQNRYSALPVRDMELVQQSHLQQRFELAEEFFLAEAVPQLTEQAIQEEEKKLGTVRVKPGNLVMEKERQRLFLSLLPIQWARKLQEGLTAAAVRRHAEQEQWRVMESDDPETTFEDVWAVTGMEGPCQDPSQSFLKSLSHLSLIEYMSYLDDGSTWYSRVLA